MTNPTTLLRALITYSVVLPVAIILGYLLASPDTRGSFMAITFLIGLLVVPVFLRWYHPILFLCWNLPAVLFFLPGRPEIWVFVAGCGFLVALFQRALNPQMQMNPVPMVLWPLLYIAGVVLVTAQLTGGIGLYSMGGSTIGGRRYIYLFGAVLGFIAMISQPIPPRLVHVYVGLFFLGALGNLSSDLVHFAGSWLQPLLYIFPIQQGSWTIGEGGGVARDYGLSVASTGIVFYVLARHGLKRLLLARNTPRLALLFLCFVGSIAGGFRSMLLLVVLTGLLVFWMEGMLRSKYTVFMAMVAVLGFVLMIPYAKYLPMPIQRSLSVLPIEVDPLARMSAQSTSDWRLQMWRDLVPEIPQYFWLGKGLSMSTAELVTTLEFQMRGQSASDETFKLSGDYHNGPLSVVIPFGIWGVIGLVWFWVVCYRVLLLNYRHGDPQFETVNRFLLALFATKVFMFCFVFGGFSSELFYYAGLLALSIGINGGVRKPVPAAAEVAANQTIPFRRFAARPAR